MLDFQAIDKYADIISRLWPIFITIFISLKPVRNSIGRWMADALTREVRLDMNEGFSTINATLSDTKIALVKSETLQTRRHKSNQRGIMETTKKVEVLGNEMKKRMDDHLIDHDKETSAPADIP